MLNYCYLFLTYPLQILHKLAFHRTLFLRIDAYLYGQLPHHENTERDRCLQCRKDASFTVHTKNSNKIKYQVVLLLKQQWFPRNVGYINKKLYFAGQQAECRIPVVQKHTRAYTPSFLSYFRVIVLLKSVKRPNIDVSTYIHKKCNINYTLTPYIMYGGTDAPKGTYTSKNQGNYPL